MSSDRAHIIVDPPWKPDTVRTHCIRCGKPFDSCGWFHSKCEDCQGQIENQTDPFKLGVVQLAEKLKRGHRIAVLEGTCSTCGRRIRFEYVLGTTVIETCSPECSERYSEWLAQYDKDAKKNG